MASGFAPAVIGVGERAEYFRMLAEVDYDALAALLRELSGREAERMGVFEEAMRDRDGN